MKFKLTKYGWPQIVILPAIIIAAMVICLTLPLAVWPTVIIELILTIILVWTFAFFRDPYRVLLPNSKLLVAPADGRITDIEVVDEPGFINGPALRIGIFLSIFDVHINLRPCNVTVEKITYKKGQYKNAMNPESSRVNESNDLALLRTDNPQDRLIVRQISGAIARRIVCRTSEGQKLNGGEKFGMIKFGSRTELYVPARENVKPLIKIGDKVKAGLTPIAKYEI